MTRSKSAVALLLCSCLFAIGGRPMVRTLAAASDGNAYFDALVARGDYWKSNSLRTQALIDGVSSVKPNKWITYDPAADAAKAVIPPFAEVGYKLGASLSPDADRITFATPLTHADKNRFILNRGFIIDGEVVTVNIPGKVFGAQFPDDSTVLVARGQYGTTPAAHSAGVSVRISQNNLMSFMNVPLGTQDGHRYLMTWDVLYTSSYLGADLNSVATGHKEFQITSPSTARWFETRIRVEGADGIGKVPGFDRSKYVALLDGRYYDAGILTTVGSNMTSVDSVKTQAGRFFVQGNHWTRFWALLDQRAGEVDRLSLWAADDVTAPVLVFDSLTVQVKGSPATVASWEFEQNTSYDLFRGRNADLVSYVRNFVALVDPPADVTPLLVKPNGGVPDTSAIPPAAPRNVRIVTD